MVPINTPVLASLNAVLAPLVRLVAIVNPPIVPVLAVISPVILAALAVTCPVVETLNVEFAPSAIPSVPTYTPAFESETVDFPFEILVDPMLNPPIVPDVDVILPVICAALAVI